MYCYLPALRVCDNAKQKKYYRVFSYRVRSFLKFQMQIQTEMLPDKQMFQKKWITKKHIF